MSHGDMTDYGHVTIIRILFKSLNPSQNRTQLLFKSFICIDFHMNSSLLNAISTISGHKSIQGPVNLYFFSGFQLPTVSMLD